MPMTATQEPDARSRPADPDDNVRRVVALLLTYKGMSRRELGQILGLNRTPINDRMRGVKPFTVAEVAAMADYFGAPVSVFFEGPEALIGPRTLRASDHRSATSGWKSPSADRADLPAAA